MSVLIAFLLIFLHTAFGGELETVVVKACAPSFYLAKQKAIMSAKLEALNWSGVFISSISAVENSQFAFNLVAAKYGSFLKVKENQILEEFLDRETNNVCLTLKVSLEIEEIPKELIKPFNPKIVLGKRNVKPKETFKVILNVEKPCYGYLFDVDALGRVYRIFPLEDSPVLLTPHRPISLTLIALPLPNLKLPQREKLIFICLKEPSGAFVINFPNLSRYSPEEVEECLKNNFCTNDKGEKELWNILASNFLWDFDFNFFEILP